MPSVLKEEDTEAHHDNGYAAPLSPAVARHHHLYSLSLLSVCYLDQISCAILNRRTLVACDGVLRSIKWLTTVFTGQYIFTRFVRKNGLLKNPGAFILSFRQHFIMRHRAILRIQQCLIVIFHLYKLIKGVDGSLVREAAFFQSQLGSHVISHSGRAIREAFPIREGRSLCYDIISWIVWCLLCVMITDGCGFLMDNILDEGGIYESFRDENEGHR